MGSGAPIAKRPTRDQTLSDSPPEPSLSSGDTATKQLLARIANAVQMPTSAFYGPSNAISPATPSGPTPTIHAECEALLAAFMRIHDPEWRRRLLTLVKEAAEPI